MSDKSAAKKAITFMRSPSKAMIFHNLEIWEMEMDMMKMEEKDVSLCTKDEVKDNKGHNRNEKQQPRMSYKPPRNYKRRAWFCGGAVKCCASASYKF